MTKKDELILDAISYYLVSFGVTPDEFYATLEDIATIYDESRNDHFVMKKLVEFIGEQGMSYNHIFTKRVRLMDALSSKGDIKLNDNFINLLSVNGRDVVTNVEGLDGLGFDYSVLHLVGDVDTIGYYGYLDNEGHKFREVFDKEGIVLINVPLGGLPKGSLLKRSASQWGVNLGSSFDGVLYRLATMAMAYVVGKTDIYLLTEVDDFAQEDRKDVIKYFTSVFNCVDAYLINSQDMCDEVIRKDRLLTRWSVEEEAGNYMSMLWSSGRSVGHAVRVVGGKVRSGEGDGAIFTPVDVTFEGYLDYLEVLEYLGCISWVEGYSLSADNQLVMGEGGRRFSDFGSLAVGLISPEFGSDGRLAVDVVSGYSTFEAACLVLMAFSKFNALEVAYLGELLDLLQKKRSNFSFEVEDFYSFCLGLLDFAKGNGLNGKFLDVLKEADKMKPGAVEMYNSLFGDVLRSVWDLGVVSQCYPR